MLNHTADWRRRQMNFMFSTKHSAHETNMPHYRAGMAMLFLSLGQLAAVQVPGFEDVVLRPTSFADAELHEPRAAWVSADYAHAASTLASHALLDRAVLYLHRAATLSSTGLGHWLSFGRALVALASAEPPYPVAEDDVRMRQLAADALGNAARGFLTQCPPTSAIELAECTKTRTLARDVLAQLVVHCDNADGALWDRCPEEFLSPLRTANLPEWPGPPTVTASRAQDPPCDVARRSWPELTREAFEREYNGPGLPVIVGNLTEGWPAKAWTDATANEHWLYLRTAQSVVRSLIHTYIHACMHTCIHACIQTHTHTYIRIHTSVVRSLMRRALLTYLLTD